MKQIINYSLYACLKNELTQVLLLLGDELGFKHLAENCRRRKNNCSVPLHNFSRIVEKDVGTVLVVCAKNITHVQLFFARRVHSELYYRIQKQF